VFAASPIEEDEQELVKLGKKLKKNNVSVDVIDFGGEDNSHKLEAFVNAVNSNGSR
jgi:26S proteasome regulatory subunit N10